MSKKSKTQIKYVALLLISVLQNVHLYRGQPGADFDHVQTYYNYHNLDTSSNPIVDSGPCLTRYNDNRNRHTQDHPFPQPILHPHYEHDLNRFVNSLTTNGFLPSAENRSPQEILVDVINDVGFCLLEVHDAYNDSNNIAISPYGVVSVLVALLEGLAGDAAYEIKSVLNLPPDINTIRLGLSYVHRHLKTYFIPNEGIFSGLIFSHDNINLTHEYQTILRFYGYDIDSFNRANYPDIQTPMPTTIKSSIGTEPSETTTITNNQHSTGTTSDITTEVTEIPNDPAEKRIGEDPSLEETTLPFPTADNVDDSTTRVLSTKGYVTDSIPEVGLTSTTESFTPIGNGGKDGSQERGTEAPQTSTQNSQSTITTPSTAGTLPEETELEFDDTSDGSILKPSTLTIDNDSTMLIETTTSRPMTLGSVEPLDASTTAPESLTTFYSTSDSISSKNTNLDITTTAITFTTEDIDMVDDTRATQGIESIQEDQLSPDSNHAMDSTVIPSVTTGNGGLLTSTENDSDFSNGVSEQYDESSTSIWSTPMPSTTTTFNVNAKLKMPPSPLPEMRSNQRQRRGIIDYLIARYYDDFYISSDHRRYLPGAFDPYLSDHQPENPFMFLVNGKYREKNVSFMIYDTILPYHYIPSLDAIALRFPLDSSMYYLLLILPAHEQGIDKLICNIRTTIDLRNIVNRLEYTHVKAVIPSFSLRGNVLLTPSLQMLGIRKIFEPRHADFSPMTSEADLYVTNIEQAVTIRIRNYMDLAIHSTRDLNHYRPVNFRADHPFLYFVMDSQLHVSLIAGKILNPLNARIR